MPIYEYACAKCDSEFEAEQRITDDPIKRCPKCRSRRVKRLISKTAFHLKGGGWYSDLYSSTGGKDGKSERAESEGSSAKSDSSTSDSSKPDSTKSDSKSTSSDKKTGSKKSKGKNAAA